MLSDDRVPLSGVGTLDHPPDVGQRHVEGAESADQQRSGDLVNRVAPVAALPFDRVRHQQAVLVVVPQRLDREVGQPGELTDCHGCAHGITLQSPAGGESRTR
jgi:hypothetical protein